MSIYAQILDAEETDALFRAWDGEELSRRREFVSEVYVTHHGELPEAILEDLRRNVGNRMWEESAEFAEINESGRK